MLTDYTVTLRGLEAKHFQFFFKSTTKLLSTNFKIPAVVVVVVVFWGVHESL